MLERFVKFVPVAAEATAVEHRQSLHKDGTERADAITDLKSTFCHLNLFLPTRGCAKPMYVLWHLAE